MSATYAQVIEAVLWVDKWRAVTWRGSGVARKNPPVGYLTACRMKYVAHDDEGWMSVTKKGRRLLAGAYGEAVQ